MISRHLSCVLLLSTLLGACGGEQQAELRGWMAEQARGMRGSVKPLPEIKALDAVSYLGSDLIIPFSVQKIVTTEPTTKDAPALTDRIKSPLEVFPLEDLQVQGVIVTGKRTYALIQPKPPNKPMHIGVGEYMGQNMGKVISITSDCVTVMETVKDNNGIWIEREVGKLVPRSGESAAREGEKKCKI
jgi:type IV pilus assembly protein PilP